MNKVNNKGFPVNTGKPWQTVEKPMLPRKDKCAAGEFEGARPASSWIIAIKNA